MLGATLVELRAEGLVRDAVEGHHVSVKEAVLPFDRFPEVDTILGPEMRSTGEVMGIDTSFGIAFAKSQMESFNPLPSAGVVFFSVADRDKAEGLEIARGLAHAGFSIAATSGTASYLAANGLVVDNLVAKVGSGLGSDATELIASGKVQLVINTPRGSGSQLDGLHIRRAALRHKVPCLTAMAAAKAAIAGINATAGRPLSVRSLQEYHQR